MAWILVTPSSRGIGHALTRHLLRTTPASVPIVATTRGSQSETRSHILEELDIDDKSQSRLDIQPLDLLSETSISDLASYCKDRYQPSSSSSSSASSSNKSRASNSDQPPHLRLAFFIPGMLNPEKSPQQIEASLALDTLKLNLLAPMLLTKYFTPFLPKKSATLSKHSSLPDAAVMALMSARVGSISDNKLGGWYSYRASKAGLNQLVKSVDIYTKMQSANNAAVVGLHPGTVKTGLSKEFWDNVKKEKLFSPEFAAESLVKVVVEGVGKDVEAKRGRCWDWKGEEVPP